MKRLFFFIIIIISSVFVTNAQEVGVKWETGTLSDVILKAQKNKKGPKLIFLDCYTTWCGPCKYMASTIFPTKEAGDYFNNNFLNIKIDMEKGEGLEVKKKYSIKAFPTFLVLDENGEEIGRIVGGGELKDFIQKVDKAKDVKNSPEYLNELYSKTRSSSDAILYIKSLVDSYQLDKASDFLSNNIDSIAKESIFSNGNWDYISQVITAIGPDLSKIQRYLEKHKAYGAERLGNDIMISNLIKSYSRTLYGFQRNGASNINISRENALKAAQNIQLLSSSTMNANYIMASIMELYLLGDIDSISKMYKFNNYRNLTSNDWQIIEGAFRFIKEIPQEKHDSYKSDKQNYIEKYLLRR